MKIEIECPRCCGTGEVLGGTPNMRARMARYDDLSPDDFGERCGTCGGTGTGYYDPEDEIEDWMK